MKTFLIIVIAMLSCCIAKGQMLSRLTNPEFENQKRASFGCAWIDYNGDQLPDPYFTHINVFTFCYENLGESNFKFIDNTPLAINQISLSGISWGDIDNDGLNDLYVANMAGNNILMKNKGNGIFERITNNQAAKDNGTYLQNSFVDYDNDGWLDIFVPTVSSLSFVKSNGVRNILYHNDGTGNYVKAQTSGLMTDLSNTTCASFSDYDNDGDQDLFSTEFFKDNWFYENNGDGSFTKITNSVVNSNNLLSLSCSWGDYDNDGNMDLFVCNGGVTAVKVPNYLYHNNGDKTFTQITAGPLSEYKGCSWSSAWGDLDNDGDLDLYLGTIYEDDIIFLNNGDGTFESYTNFERNINTTGVCMGDYNNDGFLDVLIARAEDKGHIVFRNNGNGNHWTNLTLKGLISNASGIGAKVKIKAKIGGKSFWQYRELNGNQGLRGFNDLRIHFGLGDAQIIDSLVVQWPSKATSTLTNINADKLLTIQEEMPEKYLNPTFAADTLIGRAKLSVQFTDRSIFDPNYPVTTWSWDFDGDGTEDSNVQNPVHVFSNDAGQVFTVSMTASNGDVSKTVTFKNLIQLFPLYSENVALWNKATASSSETTDYMPADAIDANTSSRWASQFRDNQWFKIELDSMYVLGKIKITWENAFASQYEIQTSTDDVNWKTIFIESKGNGTIDEIKFSPDTAKYVRINLLKRATSYGFSFYEFEIYRSDGTTYTSINEIDANKNEIKIFPSPMTDTSTIQLYLSSQSDIEIGIFNLSGQLVKNVASGKFEKGEQLFYFNRSDNALKIITAGVYICKIETTSKGKTSVTNKKFMIR
jgi:PKD repeat protein